MDTKDIYERIEYIIATHYSGIQSDFADAIGISKTAVNNIVTGHKSLPSFSSMEKMATANNISLNWLILGEGSIYRGGEQLPKGTAISTATFKTPVRSAETQAIPFYNIAARAGILSQILDTHQNPDDYIYVPNMPRCDGAIGVFGDSMHPTIKSGNILVFNFIPSISDIRWGYIYIIDFHHYGEDILCVKRVQRSELGEEYIQLVSDNHHYPPEDIPCSSIRKIASVRMYLAKHPNI